MATKGGLGFFFFDLSKGDGRGRGLIFFTNSLWGGWGLVKLIEPLECLNAPMFKVMLCVSFLLSKLSF